MTPESQRQLALVVRAVVETIDECPDFGAPGGHIYAALMEIGFSLEAFEKLMAALVKSGKVIKRGHCYFPARLRGSI
jgi:hypothetical protein